MDATEAKEILEEVNPEALLADGFDDALIGIVQVKGRPTVALYDYRICVQVLVERDGVSPEEAEEHMEFNVVDAYMGENTPAFAHI